MLIKKIARHLTAGIVASTACLPIAEASTDTHWVETVLIVASDGPTENLEEKRLHLLNASRLVQQQWAEWGRTLNLYQSVRVVYADQPTGHFQQGADGYAVRNGMIDLVKAQPFYSDNAKYNIFMEDSTGGAAAHGGGCCATYYGGVTSGLLAQLPEYLNSPTTEFEKRKYVDVGVIGHELGHVFGQPHENCNGDSDTAANMEARGLPGHQTISLMCNGFWPNIEKPEQWRLDRMSEGDRRHWFAETSGGTGHQPASSLLLFPRHDASQPTQYTGLQAEHSDLCAHIGWASDAVGATFAQGQCIEGQDHRQFGIVFADGDNDGSFMLQVKHTGQCLSIENNSRSAGAAIVQTPCEARAGQLVHFGHGNQILFHHSGQCLTVNRGSQELGAEMVQRPCREAAAQQQFRKVDL